MSYAILFYKSKRVLNLQIWGDKGKGFDGDLYLDIQRGVIGRLESKRFKTPLPPKDARRFLSKFDILVSNDRMTMDVFLKVKAYFDEKLPYHLVNMCPLCLLKERVTSLKDYYILHGKKVCRDCMLDEIKRELAFRKISLSSLKYFKRYMEKFRDFDRLIKIIDMRYDIGDETITLYDRIETPKSGIKGLTVEDLDISERFKSHLKERGIKTLLPVQAMAVNEGLLDDEDLLIVSATASGKTLIAELVGVKKALYGRKFLFLVPLVALANQKYTDFLQYEKIGLKTVIRVGMSRIKEEGECMVIDQDWKDADIIVGTYEGFDHILRSRKAGDLGDVGVIVIDEVHSLSEEERGIEIDGLIARLGYSFPDAQFIALSATVGNPREIAEQYSLKPVIYDERPIPLERHLIIVKNQADKNRAIVQLVRKESKILSKSGYYGQTIVFTNSRRNAQKIAGVLRRGGIKAETYHAGLPYSKRKKIEDRFIGQKIACVVTTAALGAGVDFPASMVIFETLSMGNKWLSVREFCQMLGRAGRPLYHERGKVVVLAEIGRRFSFSDRETEEEVAFSLLNGRVGDVFVSAKEDDVLEQVLANVAVSGSKDGLYEVSKAMSFTHDYLHGVEVLEKLGFVRDFRTTPLGHIVATGFLKPYEADYIIKNLGKKPIELLVDIHPFENVYLSPSLKTRLEERYATRISSKYFDGIGVLFEDLRKEFLEFMTLLVDDLMFCKCKEFPYCRHGQDELSKKIIHLRMGGCTISEIPRRLKTYKMLVYSGDIFNWLDGLIRKCEAVWRIYRLKDMHERMNEIGAVRKRLEDPKPKKKSR